jgi:hypothetical protein
MQNANDYIEAPIAKNIQYFTILGERCSGTHFLQHAILKHFAISYKKGEKHFFGNKEFRDVRPPDIPPEKMSLHEKQMNEIDQIPPEELLVIALVRDPVEWVDSFYKRKHHVPKCNREPFSHFVSCEFYSVYEEGPLKYSEILEDRNWLTKERYKNLFELRKRKCQYMLDELPKRYPNSIFLRYEDLRDDYEPTLERIRNQFHLERKTETYEPIRKYKGTYNALYEKKPVLLNAEERQYIWANVDIEQETRMGYNAISSLSSPCADRI